MANLRVTSVDSFFHNHAVYRRGDSDNDSAISMSADFSGVEKQRSKSMVDTYDERHPWSWKHLITEPAFFLLPSFISRHLRGLPSRTERKGGIATLDGLRGIACLIVFNERLTANYTHQFMVAAEAIELKHNPIQWPMVRFLWSGFTMANVFFIISGYVLSYKPLQQIHRGNTSDAYRSLTSSTIRRGIRLYIPTLVTICLTTILSFLGVFDSARSTFEWGNRFYELSEASPPRFLHIREQLKDLGKHMFQLFNLSHQADAQLHAGDYDLYTWAIPVEFRNSMILLLSLFAVSRLRTKFRLMTTLTFVIFSVLTQNRNVVLFLSGMLLADIDQARFAHSRHISYASYSSYYRDTARSTSKILALLSPRSPLYPILFVLGVFICSVPAIGGEHDAIYAHLHTYMPNFFAQNKTEWLRILGSLMLVWSVANSTALHRLFTSRPAQYLGHISLSFYLVHGSVIKLLLHPNLPVFYGKLGDGTKHGQTTDQMILAWVFGMTMCLPASIWVADILWRAVEVPTVRFAKWLEWNLTDDDDDFGSPSPKRWE